MKYMMLIAADPAFGTRPDAEQADLSNRIGTWWNDYAQKGRIVGGHQLQSAHTATTVKVKAGKAEVADGPVYLTDGPFNEAKETVGGYGILDVANLDEALAIVKSWPGNNNFEIRPVIERG
ncbi:MAG TPA: YciI family protein [Candidatus Acidoferrum sp.]|nr:YciI family protein [Candidatus Acidoferrum sp.]